MYTFLCRCDYVTLPPLTVCGCCLGTCPAWPPRGTRQCHLLYTILVKGAKQNNIDPSLNISMFIVYPKIIFKLINYLILKGLPLHER